MKSFWTFVLAFFCMIFSSFGMTGCGSQTSQSNEYEIQKLDYAKDYATQSIIPMFCDYAQNDQVKEALSMYTLEELEYIFENQNYTLVEGAAVLKAMESFDSALKTIGEVKEIGEATAKIDDKQIIVTVPVTGSQKNAEAEIILSNDMFTVLKSASLNPVATPGQLMGKAAMNTLLGMGSVFVVLVIIIVIISSFGFVSKIQNAVQEKNKKLAEAGIENAVAQIVEQEESGAASDDLELAAVIAAAIAAYEGSASTDGFVVRSIRRRSR